MATKQQLINKAKKHDCKIYIDISDGYVVVEIDAWNQQFVGYMDGHGYSASGDTCKEAYADAISMMRMLVPCELADCTDKFHR